MVWMKNDSGAQDTFNSHVLADQAYYEIIANRLESWQSNPSFFDQVASGDAVIAKDDSGNTDAPTPHAGWHCLIDVHTDLNMIAADYSESHWDVVAASTESESTGVVIPNGVTIAIRIFKGKGESPDAFTQLVFDYGGGSEKIFHAFEEPPDAYEPNQNEAYCQVTGDGIKKLQIIIVNNNASSTGAIGGYFEADEV